MTTYIQKQLKTSALFGALFLGILNISLAQDPIYSQFFAAPLQINPGFAGSAFAPRFGTAYRNQWPGFNNAYRTFGLYYEQSLPNLNSGIGFMLETDDAGEGIYKTNRFSATYAYKLTLTEDVALKLGVEAGVHQTTLDWDKLIFPDDIDANSGITIGSNMEDRPDNLTNSQLDISTGLLVYSEKIYGGISLKHLNTPNDGYLFIKDNLTRGLPIRYTVHGGTEINLNKGNKANPPAFISPNFLFVSQGPYQQLNIGAYAGVGTIFTGMWFRHTFENSDAAIFMMGFRENIFKLAISYDITVSGLSSRSGGTYEISLGVLLDKDEYLRKKHKQAQVNDCLGMFR